MTEKDIRTKQFAGLSEEEISKIIVVKEGLEDLNLIVMEIEHTYKVLDNKDIPEELIKLNRKRLKSLEKLMSDINLKVSGLIDAKLDRSKLS
jgi:hypothetical protein